MTTLIENRGWTHAEALAFKAEVERLRGLWYNDVPEPSTNEALANLRQAYESTNGFIRIRMESEARKHDNEQRRIRRLRRIELEGKNLQWPKPEYHFDLRPASDYWKNGCLYCQYKPQTTHDYEVHVVTNHPKKPAYPGHADIDKYGLNV